MKAFLGGVVLAILLSYLYPEVGMKGGLVHSEFFIKKIGVGVIFFCSGMKLDPSQIRNAAFNWRAHLFCQCYTFIFTPLLACAVISLIEPLLHTSLSESHFVFDAVKTLACLPPPVSSAVILTAIAHGDEAVAIFNSSVGSFLGIFLTPALVKLLVSDHVPPSIDPALANYVAELGPQVLHGEAESVSASDMVVELSISVLAPLILGQAIKRGLGLAKPPSWIGNFVLVLIIWASFCELWVSDIKVTLAGLGFILAGVLCLQTFGLILVWILTAKVIGFERSTSKSLLFASTHKSLTLGMPLIDVMFPATASAMSIAILMCHPLQILGGGILAGKLSVQTTNATSPKTVAYQAVHDATEDVELEPQIESGIDTMTHDSYEYDEYEDTDVGDLFPREYQDSPGPHDASNE